MASQTNLIAGPLQIWVADYGEALPEIDDLTPPAVTVTPGGSWTQIGFTSEDEDHEITYTAEMEPVKVMESNIKMAMILTGEDATFKFANAEHDFTAYNQAINASALSTVSAGADQTAQDILKIGDGSLTNKSLLLLGKSPEQTAAQGSRILWFPKAVQMGSINIGFTKTHKPYTSEWQIVGDYTRAAGERLAVFYDITAVASS